MARDGVFQRLERRKPEAVHAGVEMDGEGGEEIWRAE